MEWLLILFIKSGYGAGLISVKLQSEAECVKIGKTYEQSFSGFSNKVKYSCTEVIKGR